MQTTQATECSPASRNASLDITLLASIVCERGVPADLWRESYLSSVSPIFSGTTRPRRLAVAARRSEQTYASYPEACAMRSVLVTRLEILILLLLGKFPRLRLRPLNCISASHSVTGRIRRMPITGARLISPSAHFALRPVDEDRYVRGGS